MTACLTGCSSHSGPQLDAGLLLWYPVSDDSLIAVSALEHLLGQSTEPL